MKQKQQKELTENDLVRELQKAKFKKVSKRAIGDWRRDGLLPDFDVKGRGLGKGLGRSESVWEHSDSVIEQAEWIYKMRFAGIGYADLHLNLWMLGYDVHPEDVRDSLLEPLTQQLEILQSEAREIQKGCDHTDKIIEDVINEWVLEALSKMSSNPFESLVMPTEIMEAVINIFLNSEYDLDDFSFADSFEVLDEWQDKAQKFGLEMFADEGLKIETSTNKTRTIYDFLDNADFIQQHFSLHQVEKAVKECTWEDLAEVRNDMRIITKIFAIFARAGQLALPHIPIFSESGNTTDQFLPLLFNFAEILVLADISLRRNGYAEIINQVRWQVLNKIETDFGETFFKEIEKSAPVIGQVLTESFDKVERKLSQLTANSL